MNLTYFLASMVFLAQVVFPSSITLACNGTAASNKLALCNQTFSNETALGVWEYNMTDIQAPYHEGILYITKKNGVYHIAVKVATGVLTGQEVSVNEDRINFNLNISGLERVSFVLLVTGDLLSGEGYSANGTNRITAKRLLPEH